MGKQSIPIGYILSQLLQILNLLDGNFDDSSLGYLLLNWHRDSVRIGFIFPSGFGESWSCNNCSEGVIPPAINICFKFVDLKLFHNTSSRSNYCHFCASDCIHLVAVYYFPRKKQRCIWAFWRNFVGEIAIKWSQKSYSITHIFWRSIQIYNLGMIQHMNDDTKKEVILQFWSNDCIYIYASLNLHITM